MQRAGWRRHVGAELQRRERSGRGLRALLERHEKLRDRLEAQQALLAETLLPPGAALGPPLEQASLWVQLDVEVKELRREREELRQQITLVTDQLGEAEVENQEQRGRVGRLVQEVTALKRQAEELQCQAWLASQEAEGLRRELEQAQGLLQDARQARLELESRWVQEKAQEAERLNRANEQEEKYRQRVVRLREKLERLREAAGRPGTAMGDLGGSVPREAVEAWPVQAGPSAGRWGSN